MAADALSDDGAELVDSGIITEPIPVFDSESGSEPMELDDEPSELFGSDIDDGDMDAEEIEVAGSQADGSFVKAFSESLDTTPVAGKP